MMKLAMYIYFVPYCTSFLVETLFYYIEGIVHICILFLRDYELILWQNNRKYEEEELRIGLLTINSTSEDLCLYSSSSSFDF